MKTSHIRILIKILTSPATILFLGSLWLGIAALTDALHVDEARWGYVVRQWIRYGLAPYSGVIENKPPGVYLLFGLSHLLFGPQYWFPRIVGILCMLGNALLLYRLGKTWRDHWTGLIAMTVFVFASAWVPYEGQHPAASETFMNLFSTLAFYWIAATPQQATNRANRLLVAGFWMGCALAFKQIAITTMLPLGLYAVMSGESQEKANDRVWRRLLCLGAGIGAATVLSALPLWLSGVSLRDYWNGAWLLLLNRGDFGRFPGSAARWSVHLANLRWWISRLDTKVVLGCILALAMSWKAFTKKGVPILVLLVWLFCDYLGAHAAGYYFPHQFKQILPSLALAVGLLIRELFDVLPIPSSGRKETGLLAASWLLLCWMIATPQMPSIRKAFNRVFYTVTTPAKDLGIWLKSHTLPTDYVYIPQEFGDPVLYYSDRQSSSRYYNTYYIDSHSLSEVTRDIREQRPPRFIVLWKNEAPDWLRSIVEESFTYRFTRAGFWVYEHSKITPLIP